MKTAISIPDPLFAEAEALRRKLKVSRSAFYASAVRAHVTRRKRSEITESLNRVYAKESSRLDPALEAMQFASLPYEKW